MLKRSLNSESKRSAISFSLSKSAMRRKKRFRLNQTSSRSEFLKNKSCKLPKMQRKFNRKKNQGRRGYSKKCLRTKKLHYKNPKKNYWMLSSQNLKSLLYCYLKKKWSYNLDIVLPQTQQLTGFSTSRVKLWVKFPQMLLSRSLSVQTRKICASHFYN